MNISTMQKEDFQLSFFSQSTPSFYSQEQATCQAEPYEKIHKLRRLNSHLSEDNSQTSPQNFSRGSYTEIPTQEDSSPRPEKMIVKSAYANSVQNPTNGDQLRIMKGPMEKLQIHPTHMHQVQLEKMKQLSSLQEKQLETHLALRRRISLSTTSCSPSNSLKGSFNCVASPGSEEESRPNLLNIVSTMEKEECTAKDVLPDMFNPYKVSIPQNSAMLSSHFDEQPTSIQHSDHISQANQVIPSVTLDHNNSFGNEGQLVNFTQGAQTSASRENNSFGEALPFTQGLDLPKAEVMYPYQNTQAPSQYAPYYMQMQRQVSEPNQGTTLHATRCVSQNSALTNTQNSGSKCRNLVNDQMKAIQSLVLNKRSNSQVYPDQQPRLPFSPYNSEVPTLKAQRTMSVGPAQTPTNNESVNKMLIQRWNLQRAMQYRLALQQRSYYMMQQKLLMQNNQDHPNSGTPVPNNQQDSFSYQADQNRMSSSVVEPTQTSQEAGTIHSIDKFFETSITEQVNVPQAPENTEKMNGSQDYYNQDSKAFLDVDHFLTSFPDDMFSFDEKISRDNENIAPMSSKDTFLQDRFF